MKSIHRPWKRRVLSVAISALLGIMPATGIAQNAQTVTILPAHVYEVRPATLRMRAAPSLNAAIVRKLKRKTAVLTARTEGTWVKVYVPGEPEFGWVDSRYLRFVN